MKKVVLFQPVVGYMDWMRTKPSLPLGLLHAAADTSRHFAVEIVDQRLPGDWRERLAAALTPDTLCVGVTSLTGAMIRHGLEASRFVKETAGVPVVWGGVHPTLLPEQTLANPWVDMVVVGEGEATLLELARALEKGTPLAAVDGLWWKGDGSVERGRPRRPAVLDELAELPYHLVDVDRYLPVYKGRRSIFFQSSRGCPFRCTYCYNNAFNRGTWRAMSAERTLARVRALLAASPGVDDVYFVDDNFFVDLERARRIIEGLAEMSVTWQVQGVDIEAVARMDDAFLRLLERSGCLRLTIGVESGSAHVRSLMDKHGTVDDIRATVARLKDYDLILYCSFMMGVPGESEDDLRQTVDLLLELLELNPKVRNSPFYIFTPYPGTKMYELVERQGQRLPASLAEWADCEWDTVTVGDHHQRLADLHFLSMFLDRKTTEYEVPALARLATDLYRPLARLRMRHLWLGGLVEKPLYRLASRLMAPPAPSHHESPPRQA